MPLVTIDQAIKSNPDYVKQNYPQLYSQYTQQVNQPGAQLQQTQTSTQATGAEIPGIQAESGIKQVQAQQVSSPLNLKKDLSGGMTLKGALGKYTALGMSADDVFKNYLSQSPYGLPNESPTELQNIGIKPETLGQIGQNGSFADRWNTKQAILGLRDLSNKWNTVSNVSKLGGFGVAIPTASSQGYDTQRQVIGQHLSSLIPGAPGGQGPAADLISKIPDVGHITELEPGAAQERFNGAEKGLLNVKGYSYRDLGLPPSQGQAASSGHGLINSLLGSAINTAQDVGTGIRGGMEQGTMQKQEQMASKLEDQAQNTTDPALKKLLFGQANQVRGMTSSESGDIAKSFSPDVKQDPFLRAIVGASQIATTAEIPSAAKAITTGVSKAAPTVMDFINPKSAIAKSGAARDFVVNAATEAGKTIDGNTLLGDLRTWGTKAKAGNLGQGRSIDRAVSDAEQVFKDQKITPQEAANIYKEADSGFTRAGVPKAPIQSNIDRGLRDILGKRLDEAAPGWEQATKAMGKSYKTIDSPARQGVKNLAKFGLALGVPATAADIITHTLFGGK